MRAKFIKVTHYQHEYSDVERQAQDRFGSATAQMIYFAGLLHENFDNPITYRMFTDRRWDSLPGIILSKQKFNVSYTVTVNKKSRYHVINYWCPRAKTETSEESIAARRQRFKVW